MKKLAFLAVVLAAVTASAEMKIGTVDLMTLIRNHPNYETNREFLKSTEAAYKKKLDAIQKKGETQQAEGKKVAEQLQNPMLAAKAKADVEKQLMAIQKELLAIEQEYRAEAARCRQDLQDNESRLLKSTTDDLRKRLEKFAKANGYDLILDQTAAPFAKASLDVTDAMLKEMGVDPKDAKKTSETETKKDAGK
jgi:outer membrane protein